MPQLSLLNMKFNISFATFVFCKFYKHCAANNLFVQYIIYLACLQPNLLFKNMHKEKFLPLKTVAP